MNHYRPSDRQRMVQWAQSLFAQDNFYILDTETTGLDKKAEIVQIGIIDKHGNTTLETLVKPTKPIPLDTSAIHGIYNQDVTHAPRFSEIYVQLSSLLAGQKIIAYNMDFDWRMMGQTASQYRLPPIRVATKDCAMKQYAIFYGAWNRGRRSYSWQALSKACSQQQIQVKDAHTAVGDCLMTLSLLQKMAEG